jgi:hypothetical protein
MLDGVHRCTSATRERQRREVLAREKQEELVSRRGGKAEHLVRTVQDLVRISQQNGVTEEDAASGVGGEAPMAAQRSLQDRGGAGEAQGVKLGTDAREFAPHAALQRK